MYVTQLFTVCRPNPLFVADILCSVCKLDLKMTESNRPILNQCQRRRQHQLYIFVRLITECSVPDFSYSFRKNDFHSVKMFKSLSANNFIRMRNKQMNFAVEYIRIFGHKPPVLYHSDRFAVVRLGKHAIFRNFVMRIVPLGFILQAHGVSPVVP